MKQNGNPGGRDFALLNLVKIWRAPPHSIRLLLLLLLGLGMSAVSASFESSAAAAPGPGAHTFQQRQRVGENAPSALVGSTDDIKDIENALLLAQHKSDLLGEDLKNSCDQFRLTLVQLFMASVVKEGVSHWEAGGKRPGQKIPFKFRARTGTITFSEDSITHKTTFALERPDQLGAPQTFQEMVRDLTTGTCRIAPTSISGIYAQVVPRESMADVLREVERKQALNALNGGTFPSGITNINFEKSAPVLPAPPSSAPVNLGSGLLR